MNSSSYDFCGLASVDDITAFRARIAQLEYAQNVFLSHEKGFRSKEYQWPSDVLRTWSRVVEYPYSYHHVKRVLSDRTSANVLDFGSGVTFFPFEIAKLDAKVTCIDIDPIVKIDIVKARSVFGLSEENIDCILNQSDKLALPDRSQDVIYSVSVLEHMEHAEAVIAEFARVLKDDGELILTFDLDLRGDKQIGPDGYRRLQNSIDTHFKPVFPLRKIHPASMLTSVNSAYPMSMGLRGRVLLPLNNAMRFLTGKPKKLIPEYMLTCELAALRKKRDEHNI